MKPLVLLHGAIGAKDQLEPLQKSLSTDIPIYVLNFPGHGGQPLIDEFSISVFAKELVRWLKESGLEQVNIFGYSMGGYVAMYLAVHYPLLVGKIATLATKYEWTEEIAAKEVKMLDPEVIEAKVPKFAAQLQVRHQPAGWKAVLQKTASMLLAMGKTPPLQLSDFSRINAEVLLLVKDRDKMVTLDETVNVFKQLPAAQLGVLPATPHPLESVDAEKLAVILHKFFT